MSILKAEKKSFSIHYNDLINLIANDLNVKPADITTSVKMKEGGTDYFSSGTQVFDSFVVDVKNNMVCSTFNLSENEIKKLVANSFNINQENFEINLNIQYHPSLGEQINHVNCSLKKLENTSSADESIKKMNSLREKYLDSSVKNNKNSLY